MLNLFELVGRADQADVTFLNQVEEGDTAPDVFLGDADDQTRIGPHQMFLGGFAVSDLFTQRIHVV